MSKIGKAKNVAELAEILNETEDDWWIDFSYLPVYGSHPVHDTAEVFSWDDTHILVNGDTWRIERRCPKCGEAPFHCRH